MLLLVGVTALSFFHEVGPQDITRLALTEAITLDRSLRIDRWQAQTPDKALYDGHYYSDKAPGMSFLAVPGYVLLRSAGVLRGENELAGVWKDRSDVWLLRVLAGGLGFLAAVFLVGRVAEGIEEGTGASAATAFGLGTLALPLAPTMFGHLAAAALGFAAFVAVWSGCRADRGRELRWAAGGLCAGLAVLTEYQAVFIAAVLLVYLATRAVRAAIVYAAAAVPCVVALALYNTAAFDSPWRLSYQCVGGVRRRTGKGILRYQRARPRAARPHPVHLGRPLAQVPRARLRRRGARSPLAKGSAIRGSGVRHRGPSLLGGERRLLRPAGRRLAGATVLRSRASVPRCRPCMLIPTLAVRDSGGHGGLGRVHDVPGRDLVLDG
ncbi:MAG: hypothetical protein A2Y55_02345 [Actinobacteria bacterium RBG_16_68_12]|nr:MAG: hypothetical protein A2Y55_02345 [Actinobacteria bacterium RBG_16_68_12]